MVKAAAPDFGHSFAELSPCKTWTAVRNFANSSNGVGDLRRSVGNAGTLDNTSEVQNLTSASTKFLERNHTTDDAVNPQSNNFATNRKLNSPKETLIDTAAETTGIPEKIWTVDSCNVSPGRRCCDANCNTPKTCSSNLDEEDLGLERRKVENCAVASDDKISTVQNCSSSLKQVSGYNARRRRYFNRNTTCCSKDRPIPTQTTLGLPETTISATNTIINNNCFTPSHFSTSSTLVAATRHPVGENATAPTTSRSVEKVLPTNETDDVSHNPSSADIRCLECDETANTVTNPQDRNSVAINRKLNSANDSRVFPKSDPVYQNTSLHQKKMVLSTAAVRSQKLDAQAQQIGNSPHSNSATDRKSVRSRRTVSASADSGSQTDEVDADRQSRTQRQELYRRYADVMYTNPDNLQHTMSVQQSLFRQQLGGKL